MSDEQRGLTRGSLLKRGLALGGVGVAGPAFLAACRSDSGDDADAAAAGGGQGNLFPGGGSFDDAVKAKLAGRTVKIGFTPPVLSEFFNEMEHAAFWQLKEFEDRFGLKFRWERAAPSGEFETVQEHFDIVQNWVQAKFDAIFICTAVPLETRSGLYKRAIEAGTAIYEFNMPNELWSLGRQTMLSSITYDNVMQSGYLAGTYIAEQLGGKGEILQVWGPSGHWAEARQKGLDLALKENPGLKVVAKADGGYVRDKGFAAAQNLLERFPDVNAVYGENEEMALGASQAIDTRGLDHWDPDTKKGILTIGADGLLTGFDAIKNGRLTATIYVGTIEQGIGMPRVLLYNRLLGMPVDRIQNQPTSIVDKSNVDIFEAYTKWALASPKEY